MSEERISKIEATIENMKEDIKELKESQKEHSKENVELKLSVRDLVNSMKETNTKLDKLCNSFESQKDEQIKDNKEVYKVIRNCIITTILGALIGSILALILV